jgi:hypothetical protein
VAAKTSSALARVAKPKYLKQERKNMQRVPKRMSELFVATGISSRKIITFSCDIFL